MSTLKYYGYSLLIIVLFSFFPFSSLLSQDLTVAPVDTFLYDELGSEMIFAIDITNNTAEDQTIFIVRTMNNLPSDWTSSLCFESCFANFVDSIATVPEFFSSPLTPGETREVSLHVFPVNNNGTGYVQVQVGTFRNANIRYSVNLEATTIPTSIDDKTTKVEGYYLDQNYPNPFNPSTKINFGLKGSGDVNIKIYNVLGDEVLELVNGFMNAGDHSVAFDASDLASGVYFYRIKANNFVQIRKMILEK